MTWNFVAQRTQAVSTLTEYFDFNCIPYTTTELWNSGYAFPPELASSSDTILVVTFKTFNDLASIESINTSMLAFLNQGNKIWLWTLTDAFLGLWNMGEKLVGEIDKSIPPGAITAFIDGRPSDRLWTSKLKNINIKPLTHSKFIAMLRIQNANLKKENPTKDFLLTSIKKKNRPHRQFLWKELTSRPGLLDKGHVSYHIRDSGGWIGWTGHQHGWQDGYPSMNLYNDSWIELFPETLGKDGYYITEKTVKPMVTKTPFLAFSTCYYLEYLKSLGFKTFSSLIDESYDKQYRVEDRAKLIIDQLEFIIQNGTEEFYNACSPILEHNFLRMAELTGLYEHNFDIFIRQTLDEIGYST